MKLVSVPLDGLPRFAGSITETGKLIGVNAGDMAPVEFVMDMPTGRLVAVPGVDGAPGPPGPPMDPEMFANAASDYLAANPVLPPQAGQAGSVLSTDGAQPAWMDITPPVTLTLLLANALV